MAVSTCSAEGIALENDIFALGAGRTVHSFVLRNDQIIENHNLVASPTLVSSHTVQRKLDESSSGGN